MTPPSVVTSSSNANTSGTEIALTMPSSLVVENLLLLLTLCSGSGGHTVSNWTQIASQVSSSGNSFMRLWAKEVAGGDAASITTTGGTQSAGAICRQIKDWSGRISDITATGANSAATAAPNPPSHTALYERESLWLACGGGNGFPTPAVPSNYSGLLSVGVASNASIMEQAWRQLEALTEDPAAFGGSTTTSAMLTASVPGRSRATLLPFM